MTLARRLALLTCLTGALLAALAVSVAQDQKPPAVTVAEVLKDLKNKVPEDKIIQRLQNSPTTFTLGADQIAELEKAGASKKLIEEMKKVQTVAVGNDVSAFVIILDCSGSMKDKTNAGTTKWQEAQKAAVLLIESVPAGRDLALIAYGLNPYRKGGPCQDVDVLRPLAPLTPGDQAALTAAVKKLEPVGKTPIALALQTAGAELENSKGLAKLILITDGVETCDGNPAAEAANLVKTHKNLTGGVDVVGFDLKPEESKAVAEIAKSGQGKYHDAKTVQELTESVKVIKEKIAKAGPKPPASQFNQLHDAYVDKKLVRELAERVLAAARPRSSDSGKVLDTKVTIDEKKNKATYWAHMEFIGAIANKRRECKLSVECDTSNKGAWVVTAIRYDDDTGLSTPEKALEELREKFNAK